MSATLLKRACALFVERRRNATSEAAVRRYLSILFQAVCVLKDFALITEKHLC